MFDPDKLSQQRNATQDWENRVTLEMQKRTPSDWYRKAHYSLDRFVGRLLRVGVGAAIVYWGTIWLFQKSVDALSKPFATLSPLELGGGILFGLAGLGSILFAYWNAFGEGQSREEWEREQQRHLRSAVEAYLREHDHDQKALYGIGSLVGRATKYMRKRIR